MAEERSRDYGSERFQSDDGRLEAIYAWVAGVLDRRSPERILDIGCGTGALAAKLAQRYPGAKVVGLDLSGPSIETARERHAETGNLEFVAADLLQYPVEAPFDAVVGDSVLHLIEAEDRDLLQKLDETLADGGALLVSMPYVCGINDFLNGIRRVLAALRNPLLDGLIFRLLLLLYGRKLEREVIRERVPYAYWLPFRSHGKGWRNRVEAEVGWSLVAADPCETGFFLKPRHAHVHWKKGPG